MNLLTPSQFINKKHTRLHVDDEELMRFVKNLTKLFEDVNDDQDEEEQKHLFADFLRNTFFKDYYIAPEKRKDIVIHHGKNRKSGIGLIFEFKSTTNRNEMISCTNLNRKAMHELVLYYLRERISNRNTDLRHLVVTNINELFIFDARDFERVFFNNRNLVRDFRNFEAGAKTYSTTKGFYSELASKYMDAATENLPFVYVPLKDYKRLLKKDTANSRKLKDLYKALSDTVLLKRPFLADSNSLNKRFYNELLHIIGIEERRQGNKIVIVRKEADKRNESSLIETAMSQLDSMNCVFNVSKAEYGEKYEERLFNVALELSILWVNRIIFLKLLEAQLVKYHKGDRDYRFLTEDKIKCYNDLNTLFFRIVACDYENRAKSVVAEFPHVPYLNSSLFEVTDLETQTLMIGNLTTRVPLPLYENSVLRDNKNIRHTDSLTSLEYLLAFLDSYNFASDDKESGKDRSSLISSSVLGLIFEKINGHREGSVFTPGYITMYMCREAITAAVVNKFNDHYGWKLESYEELLDKDLDTSEANEVVNSLRICDPAVGSGHFLVSALNEILRIKFELGILCDSEGRRIKAQDYTITVDNDELVVTTAEGEDFIYRQMKPGSNAKKSENQRLQETLFREKRNIIENCLFGVDINPNSVNICRLRLWIELLKNTYYTEESGYRHLETLPNIDINIKHGNSLIHHFPLDSTLTSVIRQAGISIEEYKEMVKEYKSTSNKKAKHELGKLISSFKSRLTGGILSQDKDLKLLKRLQAQLLVDENPLDLDFTDDREPTRILKKRISEIKLKISRLEKQLREKEIDASGECPFEWRFEFPEVLDNEGNFIGFDLVTGNPPYIRLQSMRKGADVLAKMGYDTFSRTGDIYCLFYEFGKSLLKKGGILSFITSNKWMKTDYGNLMRQWIVSNTNPLSLIDFGDTQIFDGVSVSTNILTYKKEEDTDRKEEDTDKTRVCVIPDKESAKDIKEYVNSKSIEIYLPASGAWSILSPLESGIKKKIEAVGVSLKDWDVKINLGIKTGCNDAFIISTEERNEILARCADEEERQRTTELIRPLLRGCDIRRYSTAWAGKWLINAHNGVKGVMERIDIDNYPAVKRHLDRYADILTERTDKGDTPYNLRNCAYLDEFNRRKLVWLTITDKPKFALNTTGALSLNSTYIMTGDNLENIMACLNSKLIGWYFSLICSSTGEGTNKWEKFAVGQIPVAKLSVDPASLQDMITAGDYDAIEREVAAAYSLDEEEQDFINGL